MDGEYAAEWDSRRTGCCSVREAAARAFAGAVLHVKRSTGASFLSLSLVLSSCPTSFSCIFTHPLVLPLLVTSLHPPHLSILVVFCFGLRGYNFASPPSSSSISVSPSHNLDTHSPENISS